MDALRLSLSISKLLKVFSCFCCSTLLWRKWSGVQQGPAAFILNAGCLLVCFSSCGREGGPIVLTEPWRSILQSWLLPGWLPPWVHIAAACSPAWQLQLTQLFPASLPPRVCEFRPNWNLFILILRLYTWSQRSSSQTHLFIQPMLSLIKRSN